MKYIFSRDGTIGFPWEPGLLDWLVENYPHSGYYETEPT